MVFFRGQKHTDYGQKGMNAVFAVCCHCNEGGCTNLNGGYLMRHFYFRLILGMVWMAAAVVSAAGANILFTALYAGLGILFFWSACSIWKKEKKDKDEGR